MGPTFGFLSNDYNADGFKDILSIGNFYGNAPTIGKQDASFGNYLSGSKENIFSSVEPRLSGFSINGEARDIQPISVGAKKCILVSLNNGEVALFKSPL